MSLSLHSSMDALTSSKRGLEKDRLIEPEKSSIGESSSRISSRPDWVGIAASATRACHAWLPTSQSKDSVCRARRFGTSSGSRILAKEVRGGAPGIPDLVVRVFVGTDLPERETAKMRPSKDLFDRAYRATPAGLETRPGTRSSARNPGAAGASQVDPDGSRGMRGQRKEVV